MDVDSRPLKLRAEDVADDSTALAIELSGQHRQLTRDLDGLRDMVMHDFAIDPERALRLVQSRVIDLCDGMSRADNTRLRLVTNLRAAGRL